MLSCTSNYSIPTSFCYDTSNTAAQNIGLYDTFTSISDDLNKIRLKKDYSRPYRVCSWCCNRHFTFAAIFRSGPLALPYVNRGVEYFERLYSLYHCKIMLVSTSWQCMIACTMKTAETVVSLYDLWFSSSYLGGFR